MELLKKINITLFKNFFFMIFTDPFLEEKFREKQNEHNLIYNRIIFIIGMIIYSCSYILLYFLNAYHDIRYLVIPWSFGFAALMITIIVLISNVNHKVMQITIFISLIFLVGTSMITHNGLKAPYSFIYTGAVALFVIACFAFCRLRFFYSVILSIIFFIMHKLIFQCLAMSETGQFILIEYIFFCSLIIGLSANYNIERQERHNFLKLLIIVEDRMKLASFR